MEIKCEDCDGVVHLGDLSRDNLMKRATHCPYCSVSFHESGTPIDAYYAQQQMWAEAILWKKRMQESIYILPGFFVFIVFLVLIAAGRDIPVSVGLLFLCTVVAFCVLVERYISKEQRKKFPELGGQ